MKFYSGLLFALALLLAGCSHRENQLELPELDAHSCSPFNLYTVSTLNTPPTHSISAWNLETMKKAGIRKIHMVVNGGKSPQDTLDMIELTMSKDYTGVEYRQVRNGDFKHPLAIGTIVYTPNKGGAINYSRYFSVDDPFESRITEIPGLVRFARKPSGENRDSTKYFGPLAHPNVIVSLQNNTVYAVEVLVPEGTSTSQIIRKLSRSGLPPKKLTHARAVVTFLRKGRPLHSFLLSPEFSQVAIVKSWDYNNRGSLTGYTEYEADVKVRHFVFHYGESSVFPISAELDSKHYTISYY